jgi:hypothetical protein
MEATITADKSAKSSTASPASPAGRRARALSKRVVFSHSAIHAPTDDPRHYHPFDRP